MTKWRSSYIYGTTPIYTIEYDYAVILIPNAMVPANWPNPVFVPTVLPDNALANHAITMSGYPGHPPGGAAYGGMWTANGNVKAYNNTHIFSENVFGSGGQSGSPEYDPTNNQVLGIFIAEDPTTFSVTRITNDVISDIGLWVADIQPNTVITQLELFIRTGDNDGAGTDDQISLTINGTDWGNPDESWFMDRNERSEIDGYDLTSKMRSIFPAGMRVSDIRNMPFTIRKKTSFLVFFSLFWIPGNLTVLSCILMESNAVLSISTDGWMQIILLQMVDLPSKYNVA